MKLQSCLQSGLLWLCCLCWFPSLLADDQIPDVLTLQDAADLLRTDTETVELMATANTIPGRRIPSSTNPGSWRFSREALIAWLELRTAGSSVEAEYELLDNSSQIELAQQTSQAIVDSQQPGEPASLGGDLGVQPSSHSASEMFLRDQSVLPGKKEIAFDVGVFYSRQDTPIILGIEEPTLAMIETRAATFQGVLRYNVNSNTELTMRASADTQVGRLTVDSFDVDSASRNNEGDIRLGARYVLLEEAVGRPETILGFTGACTTRNNSRSIGGNVTLLKSLDPAVLFGSLSHEYTYNQDVSDITQLEPHHATSLNVGVAFALNDRLSLNSSLQTTFLSRTRFNNAVLRADDVSVLQLGLTVKVAPGIYLQPNLVFGLSGAESALSLGVNMPVNFNATSNN